MTDDDLSDEDKALFQDHMRGVAPLNTKAKRASSPDSKTDAPASKEALRSRTSKTYYLSDFIQETLSAESSLSYKTDSIPTVRFKELKNGLIPWEARLDLHGMTIDDARDALCQFIDNQTRLEKRCVLIIHGKGSHTNKPPIIKNQINRWLPQFEEVLAFHSAKAKDGGFGAVYVLLRKPRSL